MPGLVVPFTLFTLLYIGLAAMVVWLMRALVRSTSPAGTEAIALSAAHESGGR